MAPQGFYFIINYSEWLNWLEIGEIFRSRSFLAKVNPENDESFNIMMLKAPYEKYMDDGAFIIVKLKQDWEKFSDKLTFKNRNYFFRLELAAASAFYPVSNRGSKLLSSDAERVGAILDEPIFEGAWSRWRAKRIEERSDWKGKKLSEILVGAKPPEPSKLPSVLLGHLRMETAIPDPGPLADLEGGLFTTWIRACSAMSSISDYYRTRLEGAKLSEAAAVLRRNFSFQEPILAGSPYKELAESLSFNKSGWFPLTLVVLHYASLLMSDAEISLKSLELDLQCLCKIPPQNLPAEAAYLIGRQIGDGLMSSLVYSNNPALYTVLVSRWKDENSKEALESTANTEGSEGS
jgi:hypothetical protein